jgi:GntR family phosphonate transport system transcriptional regulator
LTFWRRIKLTSEAEIAGGRIPPRGRLPTTHELSTRFRVNRHTVRRAMEELERCGLVRIEEGRGSFVAEDVIDYQIGPRARFSEVIPRQNHAPSHRIVRVTEIAADDPEASSLQSQCGQMLWQVERLGLADGRPVSLGRHYLPQRRLPRLPDALADGKGSITRALAACGVVEDARRSTRVTARLPSLEEAEALG